MWSDPDDIENWAVSPLGAGWLFGGSVTREVRLSSPLFVPLTAYPTTLTSTRFSPAVQPRQLPPPNRARAPAGAGGLQVHVRRAARHRVERAELLLPLREHGERAHGARRRLARVCCVRCRAGERA